MVALTSEKCAIPKRGFYDKSKWRVSEETSSDKCIESTMRQVTATSRMSMERKKYDTRCNRKESRNDSNL